VWKRIRKTGGVSVKIINNKRKKICEKSQRQEIQGGPITNTPRAESHRKLGEKEKNHVTGFLKNVKGNDEERVPLSRGDQRKIPTEVRHMRVHKNF